MSSIITGHSTESFADALLNIQRQLQRINMRDDSLMTSTEAAEHLRMSQKNFLNRISKLKSFPLPYKLESSGRRWKAGEVKAWATRHRDSV